MALSAIAAPTLAAAVAADLVLAGAAVACFCVDWLCCSLAGVVEVVMVLRRTVARLADGKLLDSSLAHRLHIRDAISAVCDMINALTAIMKLPAS